MIRWEDIHPDYRTVIDGQRWWLTILDGIPTMTQWTDEDEGITE